MKPDFDKLAGEYEASSSVVIADADCTVYSDLCQKYGVRGYPTIKFYKDGDKEGADYPGGRDYDSLKKWVVDNLEVQCEVKDPAKCTEKEVGFIEKMKGKSADDIKKQLDRLEGMKSGSMKPELKQWLVQRLNILKQL